MYLRCAIILYSQTRKKVTSTMHTTKMQTYGQIDIYVSKVKNIYLDLSKYVHSFLIMEGIPLPNSTL